MNDCISRQAVINAINKEMNNDHLSTFTPYARCKDAVKKLPSITLERPKGYWIEKDDYLYVCSECGQYIYLETERDLEEFHAFCGRCGADMRGDKNG